MLPFRRRTYAEGQSNNEEKRGCTIVLNSIEDTGGNVFRGPARAGASNTSGPLPIPEKIMEMRRLYEQGDATIQRKSRNFYIQGMFMEEYEDDVPWNREVNRYFPTYHDLGLKELRGYFTWRAEVRRGNYQKTSSSLAYIYIFELLNGIGARSVQDRLRKLEDFQQRYLAAGFGDSTMEKQLRRWMMELAVINGVQPEEVCRYVHPEQIRQDQALAVLRDPQEHTDQEVMEAMAWFEGKQFSSSLVLRKKKEIGAHLFAGVWRYAAKAYSENEKDLFTACFGIKQTYRWYPLGGAVYYDKLSPEPVPCVLNRCRDFYYSGGIWYQRFYPDMLFDKRMIKALVREAERKLRKYLDLGRPLKARVEELWADPYIDAVIEAEEKARIEAARPKITIHFGELEQIRQDASVTRDSLLTEEERSADTVECSRAGSEHAPEVAGKSSPEVGHATTVSAVLVSLTTFQRRVFSMLLRDEDVAELIAAEHGMPEIVAEELNEALFDEIGDTVVDCEGGSIALVEDYREDVARLIGGTE